MNSHWPDCRAGQAVLLQFAETESDVEEFYNDQLTLKVIRFYRVDLESAKARFGYPFAIKEKANRC